MPWLHETSASRSGNRSTVASKPSPIVAPISGVSLAPWTYDGAGAPGTVIVPAFRGYHEGAVRDRAPPAPATCHLLPANYLLPMPPNRRTFLATAGAGFSALVAPAFHFPWSAPYDLILRGGTVFDGTGAPGRVADVGVWAGKIATVARRIASRGRVEIDARHLAVAPGFIDIHSHADGTLFDDPRVESVIRQGVTTIVVRQDGSSRIPDLNGQTAVGTLFARIEALPSAVNVATMVGLGTLRRLVVGLDDRPATTDELTRMTAMVETALATGACGASTGLEYTPGAFATTDELIALCRPLAARRLPYATHMRNEDDTLLEAIGEAIRIATGAGCPLEISHLKTGGPRNWHKIDDVFARIASARKGGLDLTFDRYPYVAWATGLSNRFPVWARDGGDSAFVRRLDDSTTAPRIRAEALGDVELVGGWHNILLTDVDAPADRDAVGKRLDEWAAPRGQEPYHARATLPKATGGGQRRRRLREGGAGPHRPPAPPRVRDLPPGARPLRAGAERAHPGAGRAQDDGKDRRTAPARRPGAGGRRRRGGPRGLRSRHRARPGHLRGAVPVSGRHPARRGERGYRAPGRGAGRKRGGEGAHCGVIAARPFRSTYFWVLPVAVLGSSPTRVTSRGTLKCAIRSRTKARISAPVADAPPRSTTKAWGTSPHCSSGTPTTAASCTAGWRSSTPSTSTEEMFSPPLMITSLIRSRICT